MCVCLCMCVQKSEEVIRAHETAVTGGQKSLDMDAGHPAAVLWRATVILNFWAIYFPFLIKNFLYNTFWLCFMLPHLLFNLSHLPSQPILGSYRNKIKQKSTKMKIKASKQKPSIQKVPKTKQNKEYTPLFFFF